MDIKILEHTNKIHFQSPILQIDGDLNLLGNITSVKKREITSEFGECNEYVCTIAPVDGIIGYSVLALKSQESIIVHALCDETVLIKNIHLFTCDLFQSSAIANDKIMLIAPDGLSRANERKESYLFMSGGNSQSQLVFNVGWISQKRGSGIVLSTPHNDRFTIKPFLEYGVPVTLTTSELCVIQFGTNLPQLLENYAELIKSYYHISLPPIVGAGYCTWYASYHPGAADEISMANLANFAKNHHLSDYGFEVIQIDDMWQTGPSRRRTWGKVPPSLNKRSKADSGPFSDFTTHRKFGFYPHGMKAIAQKFQRAGLKSGIWLMPFAWDPLSKPLKEHLDWFVKKADGKIYQVHWAGWCLDMSNPSAQDFVKQAIRRITEEWGYDYLKMDGLWSGMATKIRYPDSKYGADDIGDAVFYNKSMTNLESYRKGLEIVRGSAKKGTFLVGCNVAQNFRTLGASMGLLDAMRVGRDVSAKWDAIIPCIEMSSRLYFLNGRVWYNDPDCLMLRKPLTLEQARAWASWIVLTGQLNIVSEWLPKLSEDRYKVFLKSIPNPGLTAQPLDILENDPARVWYMKKPQTSELPQQNLIGFFNILGKNPITITLPLQSLSLKESETGDYIGYEFWTENWIGPLRDAIAVTIPATASRIIAIKPLNKIPQVISTSRHITQGIVDLVEEKWDIDHLRLIGKSKIVIQDKYSLKIYSPNLSIQDVHVKGLGDFTIEKSQDGPRVSVTICGTKTEIIEWEIQFLS